MTLERSHQQFIVLSVDAYIMRNIPYLPIFDSNQSINAWVAAYGSMIEDRHVLGAGGEENF